MGKKLSFLQFYLIDLLLYTFIAKSEFQYEFDYFLLSLSMAGPGTVSC